MTLEKQLPSAARTAGNLRRGATSKSELFNDVRKWLSVLYRRGQGEQARPAAFKRVRRAASYIVRLLMRRASNKVEQRRLREWIKKNACNLPELMRLSSKSVQRAILWHLKLVQEEKIRRDILRVAFQSNDRDLHSDACYALWETRTDGTEFIDTIRGLLRWDDETSRSHALRALSTCRLRDSERIKLVTPYVGNHSFDEDIIEALRPLKRCRGAALEILNYLRYRTLSVARQETIGLLRTVDVPGDFLQEALASGLFEPGDDVFFETAHTIEAVADRLAACNDRGRLLLANLEWVVESTAKRHRRAKALLRKLKRQLGRRGSRTEARAPPNQRADKKIADSCPQAIVIPVGTARQRSRKK